MTRSDALTPLIPMVLFAAMPTRVFNQVIGDVMQLAFLLSAAAPAILAILLGFDFTMGKEWPVDVKIRLSNRRGDMASKLTVVFRAGMALLTFSFLAKVVCVWFIGRGIGAIVLDHLVALYVGILAGAAIVKAREASAILGYLAVGAGFKEKA